MIGVSSTVQLIVLSVSEQSEEAIEEHQERWSLLNLCDLIFTMNLFVFPSRSFAEQNYCESRYHFLHSTDGEGCANMLVEYSTARGFRSEVDMFVAQAVLQ